MRMFFILYILLFLNYVYKKPLKINYPLKYYSLFIVRFFYAWNTGIYRYYFRYLPMLETSRCSLVVKL